MGILNNVWVALTTENEILTKILGLPFILIETTVSMLLFCTVLNITGTKKQKITYVFLTSLIGIICSIFIPKPFSNIITIISMPITIMLLFKISLLKSILSELVPVLCITILELIVTRLFLILFDCSYSMCLSVPAYRIFAISLIYILLFALYKLTSKLKFNIKVIDHLSKNNKITILFNCFFAIVVIFMQMYLIGYYNDRLPLFIIIINIISLVSYFFLSIYSMTKTMKLEKTTSDLEQEKLYNKTLQILHDNIRAFKHDFANIIAGIGGYLGTNDIDGLNKYYKQLLEDCKQVNNLSSLNPDSINNPAIYTVLANKYYKADELGIKITLESFFDFNQLHMEIYELTRILGILMDNAIEAASECDIKLINVTIANDSNHNRQLLIIENTYKDKDVNLDKIYEKGFSTKSKNTGLGLWEVNKIICKHKNLSRFTTKNEEFFKQQIEIYNN